MNKEALKKRRESLGLTQENLAEILGVTATTVSRYETGLVKIPVWMNIVIEVLESRKIIELQKQKES